MAGKTLKFPEGFLWGVSTSAYQIEGGITNDWSEWEKSPARIDELKKEGRNPEDYICGQACDSYNRFEEDLSCIEELNCKAYRLGIEWSRIEPEEGKWDLKELEHYKKVLIALKEKNIKAVVTLWHWTNPLWISKNGGWSNKKTIYYFTRYAEFIAEELGQYIDLWITINEPMAHVGFGYILGSHPPGKKFDFIGALKTYKNLANGHIEAYKTIHKIIPKSLVGFTAITDYFEPAFKYDPLSWLAVIIARYLHHRMFYIKTKKYFDFLAADYYFHQKFFWLPPFKVNENKEVNDMGWEIYPEGIYYALKYLNSFKKPVYIMENGIADEADKQRPSFIINHLKFVHKAIQEGMDVRGYFHWSLLDNYEWAWGFVPKFGLYSVDRKTFKRTARPSAKIYAEICKNNALTYEEK